LVQSELNGASLISLITSDSCSPQQNLDAVAAQIFGAAKWRDGFEQLQRHHLAVNAALGSLLQRRWVSAIPERNKIVIEKTTKKYKKITKTIIPGKFKKEHAQRKGKLKKKNDEQDRHTRTE